MIAQHARHKKILKIFLSVFSLAKKKGLKATNVWFEDMLETDCNCSMLNHKRIDYKICFVFQSLDNTVVSYKFRGTRWYQGRTIKIKTIIFHTYISYICISYHILHIYIIYLYIYILQYIIYVLYIIIFIYYIFIIL